ncbi:hypothetical protein M5K25_018399 [Dendrobium thyrsiflorum]|uniref:Uncharacterized protein n=1 Tax=Dendrobium thyrsiflorum TaxID=117978 RepID=A0ABD0UIB1_DENTH
MNLTSPRTQNSDTSKSKNYSSDCPYVSDSTTAVHSNHSQIALDFPLIYGKLIFKLSGSELRTQRHQNRLNPSPNESKSRTQSTGRTFKPQFGLPNGLQTGQYYR